MLHLMGNVQTLDIVGVVGWVGGVFLCLLLSVFVADDGEA
jgi:hypothetical protein